MARVVIAAGGTAGHVVPAIAVADALRADRAEVSFIGTRERAEADLVPAAGYEIDFIRVEGLSRRNPLRAARAATRALAGIGAAKRILRNRGAEVVLGGGGYVAGPVGIAALRLDLPLVLTEADSHLGLANRMLAGRARRVCLAFPIPDRDGDRYLVTGRPVAASVLSADRGAARSRFGLADDDRCLLVFGGSQGARSINEAAFVAFAGEAGPRPAGDRLRSGGARAEAGDAGPISDSEGREFKVLHLAGKRDYPDLEERLAGAGRDGYTLLEYEPGLGDVLAASDLVLARSGGSIFEIAAAGRPAILVPYPYATADHQADNARWMADGGAAVVIPDGELSPERLASSAAELLGDPDRLAEMAAASRVIARPDAAERVAREVLAAVRS